MHDLNNLSIESHATGLVFNFNNCFLFYYGAINNFVHTVGGQILLTANSVSDLGVTLLIYVMTNILKIIFNVPILLVHLLRILLLPVIYHSCPYLVCIY